MTPPPSPYTANIRGLGSPAAVSEFDSSVVVSLDSLFVVSSIIVIEDVILVVVVVVDVVVEEDVVVVVVDVIVVVAVVVVVGDVALASGESVMMSSIATRGWVTSV